MAQDKRLFLVVACEFWGWHPLPLHPPNGCCHCHYPATCCGGSTDLEMVGVGVVPNLSRVTNNFLFLFVFMAYELATHSTTSCTDSKSFWCHSFYSLYRFKIIFEVCDLKPRRHQNHSKLMLIYAFEITHYASGSICA